MTTIHPKVHAKNTCPRCGRLKLVTSAHCNSCRHELLRTEKRLGGSECKFTEAEDAIVRQYAGLEMTDSIARRCTEASGINRTPDSVKNHASHHEISLMRSGFTPRDLMYAFGVSQRSVVKWMENGWLNYKQWGSFRVAFESDIQEFIRKYPWFLDPDRMVGQFKIFIETMLDGERWLTISQAVEVTGKSPNDFRTIIRRGLIKYKRRPARRVIGGGLYVFKQSDLKYIDIILSNWHQYVADEIVKMKSESRRITQEKKALLIKDRQRRRRKPKHEAA
jgi:hypothetical protein